MLRYHGLSAVRTEVVRRGLALVVNACVAWCYELNTVLRYLPETFDW